MLAFFMRNRQIKMMIPVVKVINTNQLNRSDVLSGRATFHRSVNLSQVSLYSLGLYIH